MHRMISLALLPLLLMGCGARATLQAQRAGNTSPVPARNQKLYDYLKTTLEQAETRLDQLNAKPAPFVFAAALITADSNRGTELLIPETLPATILLLERYQAMGIRGVKMSVQYPLLTRNFPNRDKYIEFYKQVMSELRKRTMVVTIEQSVIVADTHYTNLSINYAGLTFERFKTENRAMAQTIIDNLHPDYLTVVGEPDTAAHLTGIQELNDPSKSAE